MNLSTKILLCVALSGLSLVTAIFLTMIKGTAGWVVLLWWVLFIVAVIVTVLMIIYDSKSRDNPRSFWMGLSYLSFTLSAGSFALLVLMKRTVFDIRGTTIPDALVSTALFMTFLAVALVSRRKAERRRARRKMKQKPA